MVLKKCIPIIIFFRICSFLYFIFHLGFFLFFIFSLNASVLLDFFVFNIRRVEIRYVIILDQISSGFIRFVLLIAGVVSAYRIVYMGGDPSSKRFIVLVNLFVLSIFFLVIRPSLISIILGWDGLGVISFLLVIYYQNSSSLKSALITIYTNRFGDVAIIFSLFLLYRAGFWSIEFMILSNKFNIFIIIFIFLAAITKRAQIPFSSWLPAAISAPTPVSSLVHSSTLVTAGVYLIIRFFYLLRDILRIKIFGAIAIFTSMSAGLVACLETDLKKVVAISTLRQLGLIIFIISVGELYICFFHIVCHALFKALLFLSCGIIIFMRIGIQDIRFIGSFSITSPSVLILFLVSRIRLFGFPFMAGFYSKDLILETSIHREMSWLYFITLFGCCIITVIYSLRLFLWGVSSFRLGEKIFVFGENFLIKIGIMILCFWSISLGKMFSFFLFDRSLNMYYFVDKTIGLIILFIGFLFRIFSVWKIFNYLNIFREFLGEVIFLRWIFRGFFSSSVKFINFGWKRDLLWGELFGSKNIYEKLVQFSFINVAKKSFLLKFSFIFLLLFVFIAILM